MYNSKTALGLRFTFKGGVTVVHKAIISAYNTPLFCIISTSFNESHCNKPGYIRYCNASIFTRSA